MVMPNVVFGFNDQTPSGAGQHVRVWCKDQVREAKSTANTARSFKNKTNTAHSRPQASRAQQAAADRQHHAHQPAPRKSENTHHHTRVRMHQHAHDPPAHIPETPSKAGGPGTLADPSKL